MLRDAELIAGEIEGPRTCYWASRERLAQLHDLLGLILDEEMEVGSSGYD